MVFKQVGDGRPYPDHARTGREWAEIPPRPVRLDQLITTKNVLDLHSVLATDSTFYGDLFPHVISWRGELYLEDGLHRALRAALQQRSVLHVRVLELDQGAADTEVMIATSSPVQCCQCLAPLRPPVPPPAAAVPALETSRQHVPAARMAREDSRFGWRGQEHLTATTERKGTVSVQVNPPAVQVICGTADLGCSEVRVCDYTRFTLLYGPGQS